MAIRNTQQAKAGSKTKAGAAKPAAKKTSLKSVKSAPAEKSAKGKAVGGKRVPPSKKAGGAKRPATKKKVITYKAPQGIKSFFMEMQFTLGKDGLLSSDDLMIEVIKGSLTNEKAPHYDLLALDPATATAIMTRLNYKLFAANPLKRLPAGSSYTVIGRLTVNKEGLMRAGVKSIYLVDEKGKERELTADLKDSTDPRCQARRRIRACGRFLAGAFSNMLTMEELKEKQQELDAMDAAAEDDDE